MKPMLVSHAVAAPPEIVYRAATDFEGAPKRISAIKRVKLLTDGPVRVGTRFEETREMFGREATETMEVVALDPGRSYVLGAEAHGCRFRSEIRVEPEGSGSRLSMSFDAQPLTLFAKVMSVLMAPFAKKMMQSCSKDLAELGSACEKEHGAG